MRGLYLHQFQIVRVAYMQKVTVEPSGCGTSALAWGRRIKFKKSGNSAFERGAKARRTFWRKEKIIELLFVRLPDIVETPVEPLDTICFLQSFSQARFADLP
ncbi:MAG: hypothetical protein DCC52_00040 [Chloroflexi bacterium]|nr:MAG: hypothetical protein DCC52_00040 [Chloroflexota bacterium]